ncbi:uncharacterized protein LOC134856934 [Symsagittifera roscoffensis]|uniref:uncharacterized protein LOC134856934 n=1 Tax=Symsagittifera roscoffensis TaxID=84072 RepID=UPI00307BAF17
MRALIFLKSRSFLNPVTISLMGFLSLYILSCHLKMTLIQKTIIQQLVPPQFMTGTSERDVEPEYHKHPQSFKWAKIERQNLMEDDNSAGSNSFYPGESLCKEELESSFGKTIWIVETKHNWAKSRNLCAVEAMARQMPEWCVRLLTLNYTWSSPRNHEASLLQSKYHNIRTSALEPERILRDTPLENFTMSAKWHKSKFQVSHLSDLLRLALLFKYGGIYSDSDILAFKSIDLQADSYVVRLRGGQIGNTVYKASQDRESLELLKVAMVSAVTNYNPSGYTTLTRALFTTLMEHCAKLNKTVNLNDKTVGLLEKCGKWSIIGHNSGALCYDRALNNRNDTETSRQLQELTELENCSMFHWTQTYFGRSGMFVSQTVDSTTLMAKLRKYSCPYMTEIQDVF